MILAGSPIVNFQINCQSTKQIKFILNAYLQLRGYVFRGNFYEIFGK